MCRVYTYPKTISKHVFIHFDLFSRILRIYTTPPLINLKFRHHTPNFTPSQNGEKSLKSRYISIGYVYIRNNQLKKTCDRGGYSPWIWSNLNVNSWKYLKMKFTHFFFPTSRYKKIAEARPHLVAKSCTLKKT